MYTELILGLKSLGLAQALWSWSIGLTALAVIISVWITLYRYSDCECSYSGAEKKREKRRIIPLWITSFVLIASLVVLIVMCTRITYNKNFFVMETIAPIVYEYIVNNQGTVISPTGILTTADELVGIIKETLSNSANLIPKR